MNQSAPSIGMPVYNGEEFLRAAIDSLLAQTFRDFELIISDNASTDADFDRDGVPDVLATRGRASEHNPRFVWARNDGKGSFKIYDNIPATDGDLVQGVTVGRFSCGNLSIALSWHQANRGVQMLTVPRDPRTERWHWQRICRRIAGRAT